MTRSAGDGRWWTDCSFGASFAVHKTFTHAGFADVEAQFEQLVICDSQAQSQRSVGLNRGRLTERRMTLSWWRRANTSIWSAARLQKEPARKAMNAETMPPSEHFTAKLLIINRIVIYGMHRLGIGLSPKSPALARAAQFST